MTNPSEVPRLTSESVIAIDTEFSDIKKVSYEDRQLIGVSFSTEDEDFYLPVGHSRSDLLAPMCYNYEGRLPTGIFADCRGTLVFHNAKVDLDILERNGFKVPIQRLMDTMLMSHYIDEHPPHGLDPLSSLYLRRVAKKDMANSVRSIADDFGYEGVPTDAMAVYATNDSRSTYDLYFKLLNHWEDDYNKLWVGWDRDFMLLLKRLEASGLIVDLDEAQSLTLRIKERLRHIQRELGFDPLKQKKLHEVFFEDHGLQPTLFSPKTGKPSISKAYLESLGDLPLALLVLEYRRLHKGLSSYFEAYARLAGETRRLHANFKQHGTLTGRLSCEAPNLQQIPRPDDEDEENYSRQVKRLFLPDSPEYALVEIDFKNIEYRLSAVYSRNKEHLEIFRADRDFHAEIARQLGIDRQSAKVLNFLILYFGGADKLSNSLGIPIGRAKGIVAAYHAQYPELRRVSNQAMYAAEEQGYVKMWTGRRRHFLNGEKTYPAFNAIIQGGSFEIVKRAMLRLFADGFDIRNQVHDSVWLHVLRSDLRDSIKRAEELMTSWTQEVFGIPFTVESKVISDGRVD